MPIQQVDSLDDIPPFMSARDLWFYDFTFRLNGRSTMPDNTATKPQLPGSDLAKLEWLIRVQRKVENRVSILQPSDAIALLKKIEALL